MKNEKVSLKRGIRIHIRAFRDVRKYCPGIFPMVALRAVFAALTPYASIYLGARIVNELAGMHRAEVLWPLVAVTLCTEGILVMITQVLGQQYEKLMKQFDMRKDKLLTEKMLSLDFADLDDPKTHDLASQIYQVEMWSGNGLQKVFFLFENSIHSIIGILGAVFLTISLFLLPVQDQNMLWLNSPLFLFLLIGLLAAASVLGPACVNRAGSYWTKNAELGVFGNRLFGAFGFLPKETYRALDLRMYHQQPIARYYLSKDHAFGPNGLMGKLARGPMGLMMACGAGISIVLTGIVYVFVALKAWAGAFGVGSVMQYVGAVTTMTANIALLMEAVGTIRNNTPFIEQVYEFLDIPNKMYNGSLTTEKRSDRQYQIEFRDVSFKYPGSDSWVLRRVNMKFRIGKRLAIVGENGSGKTTFIKLLCRMYDPQEGQILLNGIDIRKYRYDDYMQIFSVVFQDFQLISQSMGANVAGSSTYDRSRAEKALRDAGFGDRVKEMPKGLDTHIYREFEDDGIDISGGEAQKIAIARALYKDAPFIILDEPTAALDPIAEAEIYEKFNEISGDRTAIYISHRLSSCKFCDEIAVFDHGQVIQQGSHEHLLSDKSGKYAELWSAQAQYYIEE